MELFNQYIHFLEKKEDKLPLGLHKVGVSLQKNMSTGSLYKDIELV